MTVKKLSSLFLCACLLALPCLRPNEAAHAFNMPQSIKVGLTSRCKSAASLTISSKALLVGYEAAGGFQSDGVVTAQTGFTIVSADSYYVSNGASYGSYAQALQTANSQAGGQKCSAVFVENGNWQVYFGGYATKSEAEAEAGKAGGAVISPNGKRTALWDGDREAVVFENRGGFALVADANGGFVSLGDRKYRGAIQFARPAGGALTPVNLVTADEYLYSVLPSEMPAGWPAEALKAQAVAARSYTFTRMGVHKDMGYDLCDEVHCQNYLGATGEHERSTAAVEATSGVMAYYGGAPINATYFSSSGGVTENGDNVWNNKIPYLQSVPEVAETEYKSWSRSFTLAEITALLQANGGAGIGAAKAVSLASDSVSGRVTSMTITGENGSKTFTKNSVRTFFASSAGGALESTNFTMANGPLANANPPTAVLGSQTPNSATADAAPGWTLDSATVAVIATGGAGTAAQPKSATVFAHNTQSAAGSIVFNGKGWGHGVGMSQFGAKGMAETGYTYDQILKHYYTDIELR